MKAAIYGGPREHHRRRPSRPGDPGPDRRDRPRHARLRLRLGPLVLPRRSRRTISARSATSSSASSTRSARTCATCKPGDFVLTPFTFSDGTCPLCRAGSTSNCLHGGGFGNHGDGRRPGRGGPRPVRRCDAREGPGLGSLGRGARARSWRSRTSRAPATTPRSVPACDPGMTVAVVGDGAVGLSGRAGRQPARRRADHRPVPEPGPPGASPASSARPTSSPSAGEAAVEAVRGMTDGLGVDAALECVGTGESMNTAFEIARSGSMVGAVGAPHGVEVPIDTVIFRNVGLRGGVAPVRAIPPGAARRRARRVRSTRAACSTSRRTSITSSTATRRWTTAARSSRSFASGLHDAERRETLPVPDRRTRRAGSADARGARTSGRSARIQRPDRPRSPDATAGARRAADGRGDGDRQAALVSARVQQRPAPSGGARPGARHTRRPERGTGRRRHRGGLERARVPLDRPALRLHPQSGSAGCSKRSRSSAGLFGEGPTSFDGRFYTITELDGQPKPVQRPHPPFLIGGTRERMLRIAAREADIVGIDLRQDRDVARRRLSEPHG